MDDLKSQLSQSLFWDVDFNKLDIDKHWQSVIVRIAERGTWAQWQAARNYYGDERIKQAVISARWIELKTHHFLSAIYNIPLEKFRCYTTRLSSPTPDLF
jgi:hypothetical protein